MSRRIVSTAKEIQIPILIPALNNILTVELGNTNINK